MIAPTLRALLPALRFPLFQAPMAGVSTPALAAAVSLSGGLGALGLGALTPEQASRDIRTAQTLGATLLNANLFCHAPAQRDAAREQAWIEKFRGEFTRFNAQPPTALAEIYPPFTGEGEMMEVLLDTAPAVVSFHFGLPTLDVVARLRARGIVTAATATCLDEARLAAARGIQIIIAQGAEAGGHRGCFVPDGVDEYLPTHSLVRTLAGTLTQPIIAAGGIMDGRDIARALRAGGAAAQLGTAFIACPESSADAVWRERLLAPQSIPTAITRAISGRPARGLVNHFYVDDSDAPDYPVAYSLGKSLHQAAAARGCYDYAAHWAGSGANRCRALPAAQLMAQLAQELDAQSH